MKSRILSSLVLGLILAAGRAWGQPAPNPPAAVPAHLASKPEVTYESPWYMQLSKLARAGIEEPVLVAYVDGAGTFNLTPEQIISLRDLGVSAEVLSAILQHDS